MHFCRVGFCQSQSLFLHLLAAGFGKEERRRVIWVSHTMHKPMCKLKYMARENYVRQIYLIICTTWAQILPCVERIDLDPPQKATLPSFVFIPNFPTGMQGYLFPPRASRASQKLPLTMGASRHLSLQLGQAPKEPEQPRQKECPLLQTITGFLMSSEMESPCQIRVLVMYYY